jgi:PAS domain-containing protein/HAMP domain-containing protein
MSIKKLYFIIYTVTGAVLLSLGVLIGLIVRNQNDLNANQAARYGSYRLANELRVSSEELTRLARTYVATRDDKYETMYWDVLAVRNGKKPRPDGRTISLKALMKEAGFTEEEFAKLKEAEDNSNDLVTTETIAMNAIKGLFRDEQGNFVRREQPADSSGHARPAATGETGQALAIRIMFDDKYHRDKAKIMKPIEDFFGMLEHRTSSSVARYAARGDGYLTLTILLFALLIVVTGMSYFLIRKRVLSRLATINQEAQRILAGDFSATLDDASADEIGVLAKGINHLSEGLKQKADFARSIGTGKLAAEYKPASEKDTLGHSLLEMRDSLKKVAEADAKRQWATEGLATFSETLRTHNSLQQLGNTVVADLVKYLNANQGGLFLVNGDNEDDLRLELLSCYAYNRKKYLEKSLRPGEGLVGQAYLEGEKIYLTDIPRNYIRITSGLGEGNPTALLIVPLKVNEKIEGVLEIASFHAMAPHEISFVEKLGENIASALASVKINARTTRLLEESQWQSEQMRAQEEEMRQNMEEMQTTQEEMRRLSLEMQVQTHIINSVAILSRTDLKGNITYVNEEFLKSGDQPDALFTELWKTIGSGRIFRGEIKNKAKDGSFYWVDAIIAPVAGEDGAPREYIAQLFVINEAKRREEKLAGALAQLQAREETMRERTPSNG